MLSTERIARSSARHPWLTLGAWLIALVLAIATIVAMLDLTDDGELTSNPESERGYELIGEHFPPDPAAEFVNELILVRSSSLTVDDAAFREKVGELLGEIRAAGVVYNAASYYESGDAGLVSEDRSATLLPVGLIENCEAGCGTADRDRRRR